MRALGDIELQDKVLQTSLPIRTQTIFSSKGKLLNRMQTSAVWDSCGPCVTLTRPLLIEVLRASLARTKISFATTVVQMDSRHDKRRVYFSSGGVSDFDLVIGADGIRSSIRAGTFTRAASRTAGLSVWRLLTDNRHNITGWTAMLGARRTLLAIPLPNNKIYVYADCPTDQFGDGSIAVLKRLFAGFAPPLAPIVSDISDGTAIHRSEIEEVPYGNNVAERLVLIGDAAHASSPSMAQGAAMAIEDAVVLAACVSRARSVEQALSEFMALRKRRVDWVQKQSRARDRLRGAPEVARDLLLRTLGTKLYHRSYNPLVEPLMAPVAERPTSALWS